MVNLDIYTDPSRDAVQALRSNIVEVEVEVIRRHDSFACINLKYFIPKPKVNACVQKF